ncbi:MAG: hypothetical protein KatS3mg003_1109 [Candidatus Nitrosocaldaceae archaeon]|nr:MAG: hypothetical protein KatS3mg003_1109 [Candidatus Nitrosocaldaceae archaeon]
MCINDFAFACAIDNSMPYFTYEDNIMVIVNSKENCKLGINGFVNVEPYIEALISHESIHVVIAKLEGREVSDALDDIEVIIVHKGLKFQVTLNNLAFARDSSGLVL